MSDAGQPVSRFGRADLLLNLTLAATSVAVALIGAEFAYRFYLVYSGAFTRSYKVSSSVFGEYDPDFGVRFLPDQSFTQFNVVDGRVTWCPEEVFASNRDGLAGNTSIAEYEDAEIKIAVFGDSFTQWRQDGATWPDLLQARLQEVTGRSVAVLNYGRGGYGVLQMFDLAAATVPALAPDFAVFALITDDLARDRWWIRTLEDDGGLRTLVFGDREAADLSSAGDRYLVHPAADLAWCRRNLDGEPDDALREIDRRYLQLRRSYHEAHGIAEPTPTAPARSYLLNRLLRGSPWASPPPILQSVGFDDYGDDPQFLDRLDVLESSGVQYALLHLPLQSEIEDGAPRASPREQALFASLQRHTGRPAVRFFEQLGRDEAPGALDLRPHDAHPNRAGLELYARLAADVLLGHLD